MNEVTWKAFSDELVKIATQAPRAEEVAKRMRPGDIILTRWSSKGAPTKTRAMAEWLTKKVQDGQYFHAALYGGNGEVLEGDTIGRGLKTRFGLRSVPLERLLSQASIRVYRPKVPVAQAQQAVEKMREWKERGLSVSMPRFLLNAARTGLSRSGRPGASVRDKDIVCSNLIARAFEGKLTSRPSQVVRPIDLERSRRVRKILHVDM